MNSHSSLCSKFHLLLIKTNDVVLMKLIDYWLNNVENASLERLAEALDEMKIEDVDGKSVSDRIRRLLQDTPIVKRDIEKISEIIISKKMLKSELKKKLTAYCPHCCGSGTWW